MKKNDKRQSQRHKCKKIADLICEGDECGEEKYMSIKVIDQSETGMCISSSAPIDVSSFLTVSFNVEDHKETYPAEFVWTHKDEKQYLTGLKKV